MERKSRHTKKKVQKCQKKSGLNLESGLLAVGVPAPSLKRPWSDLPNPYPYGCSPFCNHPRDPELRDVLLRAKDVSGDGGTSKKESRYICRRFFGGSPDDFFARYLRSDSRATSPGSPAENGNFTRFKSYVNRRCITPDGELRFDRRKTFILALPRSRSFSNLPTPFSTFESIDISHNSTKIKKKSASTKHQTHHKKKQTQRGSLKGDSNCSSSEKKKTGKEIKNKQPIIIKGPPQENELSMGDEDKSYQINETIETGLEEENKETLKAPSEPLEQEEYLETGKESEKFKDVEEAATIDESCLPTMKNIESCFRFPRAVDVYKDRFELPIDITDLEGLDPLNYLLDYTVISRYRKTVFETVYESLAKLDGLHFEDLHEAISHSTGIQLREIDINWVKSTLALAKPLLLREFEVVSVLVERVFQNNGARKRSEIEEANFFQISLRASMLSLSPKLQELFQRISAEQSP